MTETTRFDKRSLAPPALALGAGPALPAKADVVIVGAGLLGLYAATRLSRSGYRVAVLEQRSITGGIWSMYANSASQVNSSEGGYSIKDILGEPSANRDHSTANEILCDIRKLATGLGDKISCGVKVRSVLKMREGYNIVAETERGGAQVISCRGAVLAINDRVGLPRPLAFPGQESFAGTVASGFGDSLAGTSWQGKNVIVVGMGAFAVENVRTALENGASKVTVVCRRHGTVCPKIIDYLNFVKPFDENFQHDGRTNIKQMRQWSQLYRASGATVPECWPAQIKHQGHTISVSDVWFIGHHMGKLSTSTGEIERLDGGGAFLSDGSYVEADMIVGCIGFHRNTHLCEQLTGLSTVRSTNYLDRDLMYLADAEIDEGAFNSFFGSSVLEYAKFFTEVYLAGLDRPEKLGEELWGERVPATSLHERKWSGYIEASRRLIACDAGLAAAAHGQVDRRTEHFWRSLPPAAYVRCNKLEWAELHTRLNGGKPVPESEQLPYYFDEAAEWCKPRLQQVQQQPAPTKQVKPQARRHQRIAAQEHRG